MLMSRRRRARRPQPTTDQRTPEQRLEALVREPNPERADRMMARIRNDLDARPVIGPWIAGARTLSERLIISENAFYYFTELFTDNLMFEVSQTDGELCRLRDAMEAIERAHGLREGEYWLTFEGPDEWRVLDDEWNRRADVVVNSVLRELGHGDVADLREGDPAAFQERCAKGRVEIWGEEDEG